MTKEVFKTRDKFRKTKNLKSFFKWLEKEYPNEKERNKILLMTLMKNY